MATVETARVVNATTDVAGKLAVNLETLTLSFTADDEGLGGALDLSWGRSIRTGVANVQVTKKGPKLRIQLREGGKHVPFVFIFDTNADRDRMCKALLTAHRGNADQVDERSLVSSTNMPMLATDDSKRALVLTTDDDLRALHEDLVVKKKWISEEDFWATRLSLLDTASASARQGVGMKSAHYLSELLSDTTHAVSTEKEVYRLNESIIRDIFREHPTVRSLYEEHVIGKRMSEKVFWVQFLTSNYFRMRERRGAKREAAASIFDGMLSEETTQAHDEDQQMDPTSTIDDNFVHRLFCEGYGTRRTSDWVGNDATVLEPDPDSVGQ
eukprot:Sspe_Gene.52359::Locus_29024_Transcript_1_1_Confidence_1.000_Length_1037::g.52359::m.52359/K03141/TFIIH1, GTF2H1, TFB1; transcription initiation factor TFIIH subunit 1